MNGWGVCRGGKVNRKTSTLPCLRLSLSLSCVFARMPLSHSALVRCPLRTTWQRSPACSHTRGSTNATDDDSTGVRNTLRRRCTARLLRCTVAALCGCHVRCVRVQNDATIDSSQCWRALATPAASVRCWILLVSAAWWVPPPASQTTVGLPMVRWQQQRRRQQQWRRRKSVEKLGRTTTAAATQQWCPMAGRLHGC